jgi:glucans biosynthesis protein C
MRRKDIDWLRLFGILLLFPFHAARVFDPNEANYVESTAKSILGVGFMSAIWPWFMPLLFLVAGVATWYALQKRDGKRFVNERVMRLLVPLALGILLIVPIQGYMARLQRGTLNGGYLNYLFTQFFPNFSDLSGYNGTFTPAHLWFIMYLFIISLALLPLFLHIIKAREKKGIGVFGKLFENQWTLLLMFVLLTASEALPAIAGKNPFFYGLYYTLGFFLASSEGAWKAVDKLRWPTLGMLVVTVPAYFLLRGFSAGTGDYSWQSILCAFARNLYGWCALLCMLAFARKYLNRGGKVLDYLNQAAFPVYILHQSVMMVLAYFILQWNAGITVQYLAIVFSTLIASIALYEAFRHIPPMRVVLGLKKRYLNRSSTLPT